MLSTDHSPRVVLALKGAFFLMLASLVNISLYEGNFVISAAIMLLPLFVFLKPDYPVFLTALFAGPGVFLMRSLLHGVTSGSFTGVIPAYAPEILFFLVYGLLLALYLRFASLHPFRVAAMLPLVAIDFISNLCELLVRMGGGVTDRLVLLGILGAALGRTLLTIVLIWTLDSYGVALTRKENSERYQRLVLMTSALRGELAWLKKNANLIEGTMSEAYSLYNTLAKQGQGDEAAQKALNVAKDIHDVKKEYLLIIRGIDETLGEEAEADGMYLSEIWDILRAFAVRFAKELGAEAKFSFSYDENYYTTKHYTLMAVFQNLLSNAVEAARQKPVEITLSTRQDGDDLLFTVSDTAGGIPAGKLEKIFQPGFSTKMNKETGEINRGLGLALIQDLVRENLGGAITAESEDGQTHFTIRMPKRSL